MESVYSNCKVIVNNILRKLLNIKVSASYNANLRWKIWMQSEWVVSAFPARTKRSPTVDSKIDRPAKVWLPLARLITIHHTSFEPVFLGQRRIMINYDSSISLFWSDLKKHPVEFRTIPDKYVFPFFANYNTWYSIGEGEREREISNFISTFSQIDSRPQIEVKQNLNQTTSTDIKEGTLL
jgi:hypothetical protein